MRNPSPRVTFLNPRTCGIYKDGGPRYKTNSATGQRTDELDNELMEHVRAHLQGGSPPGATEVETETAFRCKLLVPTYYDPRYNEGINRLLMDRRLQGITLGALEDTGYIRVRGGHGSPSNDQRTGHIPYIKVSDIRGLRININPTNLLTEAVARRFWRGSESGLEAWDVLTPNRASSNIGEFAILLPGEEQVVLTKEVFLFRVVKPELFDAFYLLWSLSLRAVREQWRRIALMQTNREDCGQRYREITIPKPQDAQWANEVSEHFRSYFTTLAGARADFLQAVQGSGFEHVANVLSQVPTSDVAEEDDTADAD